MSELNNNENRLAELKKLGELRAAGVLSDEEFEVEKNRILSATMQPIESDLYKAGSFATRPIESTRRPVDSTVICKICGEPFSRTAQNRFRCTICGRSQNWFGTAKQPTWWPSRLKIADRLERQWRWTHWTLSFVFAAFISLFAGLITVGIISTSIEEARIRKQVLVPDLVGVRLQSAQSCLQREGFSNIDVEPVDASVSMSEIDERWLVTRQNEMGIVSSNKVEIILYVEKMPGGVVVC